MKLKDNYNPKYTQLSVYVIITCIIIYILSRAADHIDIILKSLGYGLTWLGVILRPLIIGFALAYLFDPLADFFESRLKKVKLFAKKERRPRIVSILIVFVLAIVLFSILTYIMIYTMTHQLKSVTFDEIVNAVNDFARSLTGAYRNITNGLKELNIESAEVEDVVQELAEGFGNILRGVGRNILGAASNITGIFANAIFAIIFAVYFLLDGKQIMSYWNRVFTAILNKRIYGALRQLVKDADIVFSGYIRGQLVDALIMALLVSVGLTIANVKFAVLIGICSGIGNLIPYVGPVVGYGSTIIFCLLTGDFTRIIPGVLIVFIIQTLDGNLINPKLLSNSINIHPLLVIVSLIFGSKIGGFLGMLLAVPVGALVKIVFDRLVDKLLEKRTQKAFNEEKEEKEK